MSYTTPSGVKRCLRCVVDAVLALQGTRLPSYFNLRHRLSYIFNGLEPSVVRIASNILRTGDIAVDIGANVGFLTRSFALKVGRTGRVYAFEPDPVTNDYLTFNTRNLSQVSVSGTAISDRSGSSILHLHPTSAMSNSLVNAWDDAVSLEVSVSTFDEWASAVNPGQIRLVKIDVEGAEPLVLRGMRQTLSSDTKPQIIVEFCPANLGSRSAEEELFSLLIGYGYGLWRIGSDASIHRVNRPDDLHGTLNENGYVNLLARVEAH
jgi:FkbM family methyltransferase